MTYKKLTSPAKVGAVVFRTGVSEKTVIECAQRHYEYSKNPIKFDKEKLKEALENFKP